MVLGAAGNAVAIAGWIAAKTAGIGAVEGLEAAEDPGFADTAAAALAAVAMVGALACLVGLAGRARPRLPAFVSQLPVATATAVVVVAAMVSSTSHTHAGGEHGHDSAATAGAHDDGAHDDGAHDHTGAGTEGTGGTAAAPVPPNAFDGTLPVDLSGVPGVSPEQQTRAEALLTSNVEKLPRFADTAAAEAAGYTSIGDSGTGFEHYINWSLLADGRALDAEYPESLVYRVGPGSARTLEAAMYVMEPGTTLDNLPDVGGPLIQFHVHNDLCWSGGGRPLPGDPGGSRARAVPRGHRAQAAGADDARVDRVPPVRPVRGAGGHLRRPGPGGRGGRLRPRPRHRAVSAAALQVHVSRR